MGSRVWGECMRSGRRVLREDMVRDGQNRELLVAPDEYDEYHPQLRVAPPRNTNEESRVRSPAPEIVKLIAPLLTGTAEPIIEESEPEYMLLVADVVEGTLSGNPWVYKGADPDNLDSAGDIPAFGSITPRTMPNGMTFNMAFTSQRVTPATAPDLEIVILDDPEDPVNTPTDAFETITFRNPSNVDRTFARADCSNTSGVGTGIGRVYLWDLVSDDVVFEDGVTYKVIFDGVEPTGDSVVVGSQVSLSWTSGETPGLWHKYQLYRVDVAADTIVLVDTFTIDRDWDGSILTDIRETFDEPADKTRAYRYYVVAIDHEGNSVPSNSITIQPADWPVIP